VTLEPLVVLGLVVVAAAAGFVDSIAGGGGLLTVPALLAVGLPPTTALATNKAQSTFGALTAAVTYTRGGAVDPRQLVPPVLTVLVGAAVGTLVLTRIDAARLEALLPWLLLLVAGWVAVRPRLGAVATEARIAPRTYTLTAAPLIGAYDGFLGPGTGSFFALSLVGLRGHDLTRATGTAKVLNLTSNLTALAVFALAGAPAWLLGAGMAFGQVLGARLGARTVLTRGARIVRPALVIVSVALSLRLLTS
jgi:uncharacterized membrane protein YfcA